MAERAADPRQRTIITPEGLALGFTLASRGGRLVALGIDLFAMLVLLIVAVVGLIYLAGGLDKMDHNLAQHDVRARAVQGLMVFYFIAVFLIRNAWFIAFELGPRGATPGKRLLGMRVAARDGQPLTAERIIARNLLRDIEIFMPLQMIVMALADHADSMVSWLSAAWFALFALFPLFNRDALRAGDLIAGTWVVLVPRHKLGAAISAPAPDAVSQGYRFRDEDLAVYGEYELGRLEEVLRQKRAEQMALVAQAICDKIGWSAPGADQAGPFLEAYYTQLRARLEGALRMGLRRRDKFSAASRESA